MINTTSKLFPYQTNMYSKYNDKPHITNLSDYYNISAYSHILLLSYLKYEILQHRTPHILPYQCSSYKYNGKLCIKSTLRHHKIQQNYIRMKEYFLLQFLYMKNMMFHLYIIYIRNYISGILHLRYRSIHRCIHIPSCLIFCIRLLSNLCSLCLSLNMIDIFHHMLHMLILRLHRNQMNIGNLCLIMLGSSLKDSSCTLWRYLDNFLDMYNDIIQ